MIVAPLRIRLPAATEFVPIADKYVRDTSPAAKLALDDYPVVSRTLIVYIVGWIVTLRHPPGVVSQISYWYMHRFLHSVVPVQVMERRDYRVALFFIRLNIHAVRGVNHTDSLCLSSL